MKNYLSRITLLFIIFIAHFCNVSAKKEFYFNEAFQRNAFIKDSNIYEKGKDYITFWETCAHDLDWFKKWETVLEWNSPYAKWFIGGKINVSYNCLDRHIKDQKGEKVAFFWKNEKGEKRTVTYNQMYQEVNRLANVLRSLGIKKGDKVAIYMPLVPESIAAMLACTRVGAIHTVIFGGIGAGAVKDRILDAEAKVLLTADGSYRRGKIIPYKKVADSILDECPTIEKVLVLEHTKEPVTMREKRDFWYHQEMEKASSYCKPEEMDSEDQLFILYTSGTTGKPKGIVHTTGGYLLGTHMTYKWVFDSKPEDVFWCTADIGWITGHSYLVYGPMSNAATQVIFEGSFDYPQKNVFSQIIDEYNVTIFYTAPTLIRMFMKWGDECLKDSKLDSLRLLGSIGEPINPETWHWFYTNIGHANCPIVDTWFQTETGAFVISPLPGITPLKPGSITQALPGFDVAILDDEGNESSRGFLAIKKPFPAMMRGLYKSHDRYVSTYWSKWDGKYYYAGDHSKVDKDNYIWIGGRSDEVLKVAGHRIGTAEIENALIENTMVAEAAAVGVNDELKGTAIIAFVVLKDEHQNEKDIKQVLKKSVASYLGAYARPKHIIVVKQLPRNRSGKILRRILKNSIEGKDLGNIVTLFNKDSLIEIEKKAKKIHTLMYGTKKTVLPSDVIANKSEFIISPIKRNEKNPQYNYHIQAFDHKDKNQLANVSQLVCNNFRNHPSLDKAYADIKKIYCNANTQEGLVSAMEEKDTYAYILKADQEYIGFLLVRFNNADPKKPFLQIRRMHSFYEINKGRFYGVGKTLLNLAATIAKAGGINTLLTTAPYPIEGYFKKIGWNGTMIYTDFILDNKIVTLPQFKCSFEVTDKFKGF